MQPAFEKQTTWRRAMPITPRSGGIDGKCATPTISARSEFARSTITSASETHGRSTYFDAVDVDRGATRFGSDGDTPHALRLLNSRVSGRLRRCRESATDDQNHDEDNSTCQANAVKRFERYFHCCSQGFQCPVLV